MKGKFGKFSARLFLAAILVLIPAIVLAGGFENFDKQVTEHTLKNGIRLLILKRSDVPTVSFITWANVGSVNEVKGATGLAHLFEHMAFKGTKTVGTKDINAEMKAMAKEDSAFNDYLSEKLKGELADSVKLKQLEKKWRDAVRASQKYVVSNELGEAIQRAGGVGLNASTNADATVYMYNLPSNRIELWMSLESDRFLNPVLREFYTERDVVMEERRLRTDSQPIGTLLEQFIATAYMAHPYSHPVVGYMSDLQALTRAKARKFFQTYYVPQNLVLAIVGDVNVKKTIKMAETYFGRIPRAPEPPKVVTVEPPQPGERIVEVENSSQPILLMGFHRPAELDKNSAVLDVINDVLGQGRTSWLYKSLVKKDKIAIQTGAISSITYGKYPGLFIFYAVVAKGHTNDECEKAVWKQIERIKTTPLSDKELDAVKTRARVNFLRQLQSNQGLALQLAWAETILGDYHQLFRQVDKINAVTKEDIQRVAQKIFVKRNCTVGKIVKPETASK